MDIKLIEENVVKLNATINERQEKFSAWLKNIITIAAGLIAVLVSLKKSTSPTHTIHYLFVTTIALLSLGILAGSLVLYHEVHLLDKERKVQYDYIKILMEDSSASLIETIHDAWYYKPSLWVALLSFCISLVSLTWYAVLIDA